MKKKLTDEEIEAEHIILQSEGADSDKEVADIAWRLYVGRWMSQHDEQVSLQAIARDPDVFTENDIERQLFAEVSKRAQWALKVKRIVCVIVAAAEAVTGIDLTKGIVIGLLTAHLFDWRQ